MKTRAKYVLLTALLGIGLTSATYLLKNKHSLTSLSCQSRHTLVHGHFTFDANYSFTFGKELGDINISGIAVDGDEEYPLNRLIHFTYRQTDNVYTLTSRHIEYMSTDKSRGKSIDLHFPSFFYEEGKNLTITLERDKYGVPVIYLHNTPVFYCKTYSTP